jgi:hypothetical protein
MTGAANILGPRLLAATLAVPLLFLAACLSGRLRSAALALQWLAPIPALGAAILAIGGGPFGVDWPALRVSLRLDLPGALILAVVSLMWIVVGAATFSGEAAKAERALRGLVAPDAERQSRRLRRRRSAHLLSLVCARQHSGL